MKIISHRGYWVTPDEKNSLAAIRRSAASGFGTEVDLRDHNGKIVISHDPPSGSAVSVDELLAVYAGSDLTIAVNIKADGIGQDVKEAFTKANVRYFCFDMSVPQTVQFAKQGVPFFSRQSEYELTPTFYDDCAGVWLDAFNSEWYGLSDIRSHLFNRKEVCLVSPELHGRNHEPLWRLLKEDPISLADNLILCTDFPEKACAYFGAPE